MRTSFIVFKEISKALSGFRVPDEHHWFFGIAHLINSGESYVEICQRHVEKYRPKAFATWLTWLRPAVVVVHPDTIKDILKANHMSAPKSPDYDLMVDWIGDGLVTASGRKWERRRRLLTPVFHFDVLKPYVKIYNDVAEILLSKILLKGTGRNSVDVFPLINRATLDLVLRCALSYVDEGVQNADSNQHPYCEALATLKGILMRRVLDPISHSDFIFYLKVDGRKFKKNCDYVHEFSDTLIKARRKSLEEDPSQLKKRHLDFIDVLLTTRDEYGDALNDTEIRNEVDTFVYAGPETTASVTSWTLYNFAKYPKMQQDVRDEIKSILDGRTTVEHADLQNLPFTTCFIKETMRTITPLAFFNRRLSAPVTIEGVTFPAGTLVDILPWCLHHHPDVWENPDEFDPDRFLPDNVDKKDPFAFLPFSAGQRNCIGQHFAMNVIKVLVSRIVAKFEISLDETREPVPVRDAVTTPKDGIYLHLSEL